MRRHWTSHVDPRTGQNMDSDILIEASTILGYKNYYRRWAGPETAEEVINGVTQAQLDKGLSPRMCEAAEGMMEGGNMMDLSMMLTGSLAPGSPVPDQFIGQALKDCHQVKPHSRRPQPSPRRRAPRIA